MTILSPSLPRGYKIVIPNLFRDPSNIKCMKTYFENIKSPESGQEIVGQPHRRSAEGETTKRVEREIDIAGLAKKLAQPFADQVIIKILGSLVLELKERFNQYDTILSDDTSGRLVSLFFEKIINKQREEEGKNKTKI